MLNGKGHFSMLNNQGFLFMSINWFKGLPHEKPNSTMRITFNNIFGNV